MQFKNICIDDIDFSCRLFRFLPVDRDRQKRLFTDVAKNGILSPPILINDKDSGKFIIVSGFKRLLAFLKTGEKYFNALVMDYCRDSFVKGFYLRWSDNGSESSDESLTFYARARLYKMLYEITEIFPEIDFQKERDYCFGKNKSFIRKISLFAETPLFVQKSFLNQVIALPVLFEVLKYDCQEIRNILTFFQELSPGLNRQRELLSLVEELSHNEDKSISEIIGEDFISETVSDDKLSRPQKLSTVISHLTEKRYPEMIRLRESFVSLAKESDLSENPKIIHPKNFEDSNFKIELKFNNIETYLKLCKKMSKSFEKGDIQRFFELI